MPGRESGGQSRLPGQIERRTDTDTDNNEVRTYTLIRALISFASTTTTFLDHWINSFFNFILFFSRDIVGFQSFSSSPQTATSGRRSRTLEKRIGDGEERSGGDCCQNCIVRGPSNLDSLESRDYVFLLIAYTRFLQSFNIVE